MKQFLLTKRTRFSNLDCGVPMGPFREQSKYSDYDEHREHEIFNLKASSLEDAAALLGLTSITKHDYDGKRYFKMKINERYCYTFSEWIGSHELGLLWPGKF